MAARRLKMATGREDHITTSTEHLYGPVLRMFQAKTPFASPRVARRWPQVGPRCPQDAPKTGQDSPKMVLSMPTMAQESLLQRRCHNNLTFTSSTSYFLHTSRAKTQFSSCQDGPKTLPNGLQLAPRRAKIAPKWPKIAQDRPKRAQDGSLKKRCHINIELASSWAPFWRMSRAKTPFWAPPEAPTCPRVATK